MTYTFNCIPGWHSECSGNGCYCDCHHKNPFASREPAFNARSAE